jgi:hypothetical protein
MGHSLPVKKSILIAAMSTISALHSSAENELRHVVLFKFKDGVAQEEVTKIEKAFAELPKKIDTVQSFEWGTSISLENINDGFTHCFLVTFKDKAGLEVYIPHPEHSAFVALLKPVLDKALVFDYIATK